jgi:hypothetical protein
MMKAEFKDSVQKNRKRLRKEFGNLISYEAYNTP